MQLNLSLYIPPGSKFSTMPNRMLDTLMSPESKSNVRIGFNSPPANMEHFYEDLIADTKHRLKITSIDTKERAQIVLQNMKNAPPNTIFACDTEVADIDVKTQGCKSCYPIIISY